MSYISAIRTGDDVLVWERNDGKRSIETYRAPYYFYLEADVNKPDLLAEFDSRETAFSYKGVELKRYDFPDAKSFQMVRAELQSSAIKMYESDIPPEVRILSQHYYKKPTPALNITFVDIEVDYDPINGFSSVYNPYAPINSVALYHRWQKRYVVLCVPPDVSLWGTGVAPEGFMEKLGEISPMPNEEVEIIFCKDEKELLMHLLVEIEDTDVLSGWNSEFFDVPYIGKRLEKLGRKYFRQLSFEMGKLPEFKEVIINKDTNQKGLALELSGRVSLDYLLLFKKYEQAGRPSYKLEAIGDEIVPELPKLSYEGSLADLYRKDFPYFIRYNLRDTEVLDGFERKLGYVNLANEMVHMSTGLFKHVTGTIKLSELSVVNECHHELGGLVVNDITRPDVDRQIKGALVLFPQRGEHKHTGSIDVKSLYPSSIIALNISPETLRGQFVEEERASIEIGIGSDVELHLMLEDGTSEIRTAREWRDVLWERKWAVSGYGTAFDQTKMGIIPTILAKWFQQRIEYQKLMRAAKDAGDKDKADYYDRLQYVFKIKLNSFYGALSNLYFRFYDLRMGESTTGTGRAIVTHQCRKANELLTGTYDVDFPLYGTMKDAMDPKKGGYTREEAEKIALDGPKFNGKFQADAVIYGDTDSTYFATFTDNLEDAIKVANFVAKKVNASYQGFMRERFLCQPGFDSRISCSREVVTGRGIFVDKKRYILHLLDLDGKAVDKMKVMGLDTKKTTLPKEVSKKLNGFVERYLKGEAWDIVAQDIVDYKEQLLSTNDLMSIGLPKGINGIEDYTEEYKGNKECSLPGHVAASMFYNLCLDDQKDKRSLVIRSGMKIKVFYLTRQYGRFKSIAIPVDIEEVPKWFYDNFEVDREAHVERLVDNPLQNIIKAIGKEVPTRQSLFVDSVLSW